MAKKKATQRRTTESRAGDTKLRALQVARSLTQSFGFSGFSLQTVAEQLGIKKPSLYVHFKSKEELGQLLIKDYHQQFLDWTETISIFPPVDKVGALFETFFKFSVNDAKLCPLSAMIADLHSLPKGMIKPVKKVFAFQADWLRDVIDEGQRTKVFRRDLKSRELAETVLAAGFGAQLIARVSDHPEHLQQAKLRLLGYLQG